MISVTHYHYLYMFNAKLGFFNVFLSVAGKDDAIDCQYSECASGHMQAVKVRL